MQNELLTSIIVNLKGNLGRQAKRNEQYIDRFAKNSSRSLKGLRRNTTMTSNSFGSMGKKLAGIATAAAAIRSANKVIEFDANLTQLQTDGQASAEQIAKLKKELIGLANDPSIRLDKSVLLGGFDKIIAQTGDFTNAQKNLRNLAQFIRATGAAGEDAGAMIAIAFKNGLTEVSQVQEFLGIQYKQSLTGSVPLREIAKTGKGLYSPVTASVGSSAETLRDAGAVAQITIDAVKSADEAAEAIKSLVSALNKKEVQKILSGAGIETRKPNSILLRRLPDLIPEIYKAAGGDFGKLGKLFGESGVKVFQGYSKPRGEERLRELAATTADGSLIEKNARINASTAKAAKQSVSNKTSEMIDSLVSKPTKDLANAMDQFQKTDAWTNAKAIDHALGAVVKRFTIDIFNDLAELTVGNGIRGIKSLFADDEQPAISKTSKYSAGLRSNNNNLAEDFGKVVARELNKNEATVKLEIESKDARVKTKQVKTEGMEIELDSALAVGGA